CGIQRPERLIDPLRPANAATSSDYNTGCITLCFVVNAYLSGRCDDWESSFHPLVGCKIVTSLQCQQVGQSLDGPITNHSQPFSVGCESPCRAHCRAPSAFSASRSAGPSCPRTVRHHLRTPLAPHTFR